MPASSGAYVPPLVSHYNEFRLYQTARVPSKGPHGGYALVCSDSVRGRNRVISIVLKDCGKSIESYIFRDEVGDREVHDALTNLAVLRPSSDSPSALRRYEPLHTGAAILGLIRFTKGYYLVMAVKSVLVGFLASHAIYEVLETATIPMWPGSEKSALFADDEKRYKDYFQLSNLSHGYFFSHTLDMTLTLQGHMASSKSTRRKYDWGQWLRETAKKILPDVPTPPLIHGAVVQSVIQCDQLMPECSTDAGEGGGNKPRVKEPCDNSNLEGNGDRSLTLYLTVIARASAFYAGVRYQKRGVNGDGHVANHVEVEQIITDVGPASLQKSESMASELKRRTEEFLKQQSQEPGRFPGVPPPDKAADPAGFTGRWTSLIQIRGSVPLFWHHEPGVARPKPPILYGMHDNSFSATKRHFHELLEDYGAPVVCISLLKGPEKSTREATLASKYREAIHAIMSEIQTSQVPPPGATGDTEGASPATGQHGQDPSKILRLFEFDFRTQTNRAWNEMISLAERACDDTNIFQVASDGTILSLQRGVIRSNCVDCVDRTNYAQFFVGLFAAGRQLQRLGVLKSCADLAFHSKLIVQILSTWVAVGDRVGMQYGGSKTVGVGFYDRGVVWDRLMNVHRFIRNSFQDRDNQMALNLLLGRYRPLKSQWVESRLLLPLATGPSGQNGVDAAAPVAADGKAGEKGISHTLANLFGFTSAQDDSEVAFHQEPKFIALWDISPTDEYALHLDRTTPRGPVAPDWWRRAIHAFEKHHAKNRRQLLATPNIDCSNMTTSAGHTLSPGSGIQFSASTPMSTLMLAPVDPSRDFRHSIIAATSDYKGSVGGWMCADAATTKRALDQFLQWHKAMPCLSLVHEDAPPPMLVQVLTTSFVTEEPYVCRTCLSPLPEAFLEALVNVEPDDDRSPAFGWNQATGTHGSLSAHGLIQGNVYDAASTAWATRRLGGPPNSLGVLSSLTNPMQYYLDVVRSPAVNAEFQRRILCRNEEVMVVEEDPYLVRFLVPHLQHGIDDEFLSMAFESITFAGLAPPTDKHAPESEPFMPPPMAAACIRLLRLVSTNAGLDIPSSFIDVIDNYWSVRALIPGSNGTYLTVLRNGVDHALRDFKSANRGVQPGEKWEDWAYKATADHFKAVEASKFRSGESSPLRRSDSIRLTTDYSTGFVNVDVVPSGQPHELVDWVTVANMTFKIAEISSHCSDISVLKKVQAFCQAAEKVMEQRFAVRKKAPQVFVDAADVALRRETRHAPHAFSPHAAVMASFSKKVLATQEDVFAEGRRWLALMIRPFQEGGVLLRHSFRFCENATDKRPVPQASKFENVFLGSDLVAWVIGHQSELDVRIDDNEFRAETFATRLCIAGFFHPVALPTSPHLILASLKGNTHPVNPAESTSLLDQLTEEYSVGLVNTPQRFNQSIEAGQLYTFLCFEKRVVFDVAPTMQVQRVSARRSGLGSSTSSFNREYHAAGVTRFVEPSLLLNAEGLVGLSYAMAEYALRRFGVDESNAQDDSFLMTNFETLSAVDLRVFRLDSERTCFFVNLYNVLFYKVMNDRSSLTPLDFAIAEQTRFIRIRGALFSLADIKHGILRGNAAHPRCLLPQFDTDDTRRHLTAAESDPRVLLLLADLPYLLDAGADEISRADTGRLAAASPPPDPQRKPSTLRQRKPVRKPSTLDRQPRGGEGSEIGDEDAIEDDDDDDSQDENGSEAPDDLLKKMTPKVYRKIWQATQGRSEVASVGYSKCRALHIGLLERCLHDAASQWHRVFTAADDGSADQLGRHRSGALKTFLSVFPEWGGPRGETRIVKRTMEELATHGRRGASQ